MEVSIKKKPHFRRKQRTTPAAEQTTPKLLLRGGPCLSSSLCIYSSASCVQASSLLLCTFIKAIQSGTTLAAHICGDPDSTSCGRRTALGAVGRLGSIPCSLPLHRVYEAVRTLLLTCLSSRIQPRLDCSRSSHSESTRSQEWEATALSSSNLRLGQPIHCSACFPSRPRFPSRLCSCSAPSSSSSSS